MVIFLKMIPSPDWIVGLSKENLCLANCSWVDNRVIDLYPWDIGTDRYVHTFFVEIEFPFHSSWQRLLGPKKVKGNLLIYRTKGIYCGYMGNS